MWLNRDSAWVIVSSFIAVTLISASPSPFYLRSKRQAMCTDGNYTHEGLTCCLCAAGKRLVKHCTTKPDDGECKICELNTYNSEPNNKETCEHCRSCLQSYANMEVAEECTSARDTKCRCKAGYFCNSGTDSCILCHPCKTCGDAGVKEACNATRDTVCNDESQAGQNNVTNIIVPIVVIGIIIAGVGFALYVYRRMPQWRNQRQPEEPDDPLLVRLNGVNLQSTLPDIADILGWKTMKNVAIRSEMMDTVIQSCQQNHQGDSQEQTLELLSKWVEMQGRVAPEKLIKTLQQSRENRKAEKVREIFSARLNN